MRARRTGPQSNNITNHKKVKERGRNRERSKVTVSGSLVGKLRETGGYWCRDMYTGEVRMLEHSMTEIQFKKI